MNLIESFKIALSAIWVNKMRSLLTMLGIIIGISSVITVVALGNGSEALIGSEFENFGVNRIYLTTNFNEEVNSTELMTHQDVAAVERAFEDKISAISISVNTAGKVSSKRLKDTVNVSLSGVDDDYNKIEKIELLYGRYLAPTDIKSKRSVAVIDAGLAKDLYGRTDVVGEKLVVNSKSTMNFVIIGVYKEPKSNFSNIPGFSVPKVIYVPYSLIEQYNGTGRRVGGIEVNLLPEQDANQIIKDMVSLIEHRHGNVGKDKYRGFSAEKQLESINNVMGVLTAVIGAIAAISLVVGGIGVMNIMLVSVTERTREIGIRKALGARRRDILIQFLVEAVLVASTGGVIGTILGFIFAVVIASVIHIPPSVDPMTVVIAWLFSAGVGIFFGIYPANQAAKLDPIEALRYE